MAKMMAAAHGENQYERTDCCSADDKFRAPRGAEYRRAQQRARESRAAQREIAEELDER
jgi:hypothetical protein